MKKILWLASWYPDKLEPLSGDFIERHAKAASLLNDITVIHVVKDHANKTSGKRSVERKQYHTRLSSITGYYTSSPGLFGSLISVIRYFFFQKDLIDQYIREHGRPDVVHVHICYKAGIGALYCRWKYGIPYIVSEQWTIFCPEAKPGYADQSFIARWLIKLIYRKAVKCSAVSEYLGKCLSEKFHIPLPVRIPNVVDTTLFYPSAEKYKVFTFIHISVLNYQKSPFEIFEAIRLLKQQSSKPFQFIVYGPALNEYINFVNKNNLDDIVQFRGEVMQDILAADVRKCNALVLYSRFETFGCVIIEALASGLPVIVSDIPVMHELIQENVSGVFVPLEKPQLLAEKMKWVMENHEKFNKEILSATAHEYYSFNKIGEMFDQLYTSV